MNEEEFKLLKISTMKKLNKEIAEFRDQNPTYEIFNISIFPKQIKIYWVIWRIKK